MENKNLKQELLDQIETELEFCNGVDTPLVCANMADSESKKALVDTIANTCITEKLTIEQSIAQVEKMYGNNDID